MARIRQDISFLDLFGDEMQGIVSLRKISRETYTEVFNVAMKKFGPSLKRITFRLLVEAISNLHPNDVKEVRLKFRKSLWVSVRIVEVEGTGVTISLVIDDLTAPGRIADELLRRVVERARCRDITVEGGVMVGSVTLPSRVIQFREKRPGIRKKKWPTPDSDVDHEMEFLKVGLHLIR